MVIFGWKICRELRRELKILHEWIRKYVAQNGMK
jgi:hypothetical protein